MVIRPENLKKRIESSWTPTSYRPWGESPESQKENWKEKSSRVSISAAYAWISKRELKDDLDDERLRVDALHARISKRELKDILREIRNWVSKSIDESQKENWKLFMIICAAMFGRFCRNLKKRIESDREAPYDVSVALNGNLKKRIESDTARGLQLIRGHRRGISKRELKGNSGLYRF